MLLSRKRAREPLNVSVPAMRHRTCGHQSHIDEKWFLRDLLHNSSSNNSDSAIHGCATTPHETEQHGRARCQVVEFLHRHNRIADHNSIDVYDNSLQLSQARMSSQELFLSVVLEWQRAETQMHHPTLPGRAHWSSHAALSSSALPSSSESDDDTCDSVFEDTPTRHSKQRPSLDVHISPTRYGPQALDDNCCVSHIALDLSLLVFTTSQVTSRPFASTSSGPRRRQQRLHPCSALGSTHRGRAKRC